MTDPDLWETLSSQHSQFAALWAFAWFVMSGDSHWLVAVFCMVMSVGNLALCLYAWRIKGYLERIDDT